MVTPRWQFWLGFGFFVSVLVGTGLGLNSLYQVAMDANQVPLRRLQVQGELHYVSRDEVRAVLVQQPLGSFFSADVDVIRAQVEQIAWVKRASIRKEWPDLLRVFVVEQQPLAHWNPHRRERALVNTEAQVFEADTAVLTQPLPRLQGPETAVVETVQQYRSVQELLQLNGHQVSELRFSERFAVDVVLQSGVELRLGREALLERVQRFIDLYPQLSSHRQQPIDYVDLRYDTGVAVSWREPNKPK
jgi:cell division protein FtsQ